LRVSEFYDLGRTQATLDFVDVDLTTDVGVYLSPSALLDVKTPWSQRCVAEIQDFFSYVIGQIQKGNHASALNLLGELKEPNETHLGMSKDEPDGRALGEESAKSVWASLANSEAAKTGLLQDLEDTVLLVKFIRTDKISDITTNIIRRHLIAYTQRMCEYYGIPTEEGVASGVVWSSSKKKWEQGFVSLPVAGEYGKLLLVPKSYVRVNLGVDASYYYRHYLLTRMQSDSANRGLAKLIKAGPDRGAFGITKTSLIEEYGSGKDVILEQTLKFPEAMDEYRQDRAEKRFLPLSHEQVADALSAESPDWNSLLDDVTSLKTGRDDATKYENAIEALLSALFYPALHDPIKQFRRHDGRKIIDITYANSGVDGFFKWVQSNYPAGHISVECKNYGKEIGNPELDQLAGRFSPSFGKVGILVCRSAEDPKRFMQRCRDTARDDRGFIIPLYDKDLITLVKEKEKNSNSLQFNLLMTRFRALIS